MHAYPSVPGPTDAAEGFFERGHLWIFEWVDGRPLRFSVEPSGLVIFGDDEQPFPADGEPPAYRAAVRHVRERLDREALRMAVDDPSNLTFVGIAPVRRRVEYDWPRLPPFLGLEVWAGEERGFVPPDAATRAFERIGLEPVNALRKEVRAAHFDPSGYAFPDSAWYDGPVAGVLLRNKRGGRARIENPAVSAPALPDGRRDPAELGAALATADRVERAAATLDARGRAEDPDALAERVLALIYREADWTLEHELPESGADAFRAAVHERVRSALGIGG